MAIGSRRKGTGGVVTAPPIPVYKALRTLEKAYSEKVAENDQLKAEVAKFRELYEDASRRLSQMLQEK